MSVALSKELVRITRHGKHGLAMDESGFVAVDDIVRALGSTFPGVSLESVQSVANSNDKKRFELKFVDSRWMLKATQGHTVSVTNLDLNLLTDPYKYQTVIHGTYMHCWCSIKESGLRRMKRTHIHFAIGLPGDVNVISGMPSSCDVVIYIDMPKAMHGGIKFYESSNKVILSEGNYQGTIPTTYFKKVVQLRPKRQDLSF